MVLVGSNDSAAFTAYLDGLTDPSKPKVLCTITTPDRLVTFATPNSIGVLTYSDPNDPTRSMTQISTLNLVSNKSEALVTVHGDVLSMSWSSDGSMLAYLLYANDASGQAYNQLWLKVGSGVPAAISPQIPLFGRDGSLNDQLLVRFSPDDKYVLMVDTWVAGAAPPSAESAIVQVRSVPDGKLVWVPPAVLSATFQNGSPLVTMAAWSNHSDRVYYRDSSGVHVWSVSGGGADVAAGLEWFSPSVAPDDSVIAYAVNLESQPHIELRNVSSSTVSVLPGERASPFLLAPGVLVETHYGPCAPAGPGCPSSGPQGGPYVLDLTTDQEVALPGGTSAWVMDVWPR